MKPGGQARGWEARTMVMGGRSEGGSARSLGLLILGRVPCAPCQLARAELPCLSTDTMCDTRSGRCNAMIRPCLRAAHLASTCVEIYVDGGQPSCPHQFTPTRQWEAGGGAERGCQWVHSI